MPELLILGAAGLLAFAFCLVKSWRLSPSTDSQFELERRANQKDEQAVLELARRGQLPLLIGLQRVKMTVIAVVLLGLLMATHPAWAGMLIGFGLLITAELAAARGWCARLSWNLQQKLEPLLQKFLRRAGFLLRPFAPARSMAGGPAVASRAELQQLIAQDQTVLGEAEKARLLGSLDFAHTLIAQAMVSREQITSVQDTETVGPLLLDRLHKAGHNIFPVIHKDIDHVKGLLYMADLVPLDPDLKHVQDALRPTVHYLPANAHLSAVLSASLQTGRQLFLAVNEAGETQGLITLADTLKNLLGQPVAKDSPVSTKAR